MEYYTYILRCSDGSLYTGITTDLARRFSEHAGGTGRAGAKYTAAKKPVAYECAFVCPDRSSASRLEAAIKRLTRAQKLRLISGENSELAELSLASRFPLLKYE